MSFLGNPLLGDSLYNTNPGAVIKRQALHSYKMCFIHPITNKKLELYAPIPKDMLNLLQ